jgi:hypothetical protein
VRTEALTFKNISLLKKLGSGIQVMILAGAGAARTSQNHY